MLTSLKKPVLIRAQPTHVDLFVEYYDLLRRWALQFTEHDKDLAEDLLHDTFIHFTLSKPDLDSIQNLDGYLFVTMRNLHLSQLRRATRSPIRSFSVAEYDTADMTFWASDPRDHLRMRDELNAVCQFVCIRKEGSKAGSILILRFFHGYYPDEIAMVAQTTRGAVNAGLKQGRAEARLYLEEPERLGLVGEKTQPTSKITINSLDGDLRLALRGQIFGSRKGDCLTMETLEALYKSETVNGIDRQSLAHIVSCQTCIETVNSLLGLPPLASRYPLDTIGKDPGKKGGSGGGSGGAGGGPNMLDSYISRRDAHYYHEPKELCISANGQFQGLQKIVLGKGEFMLVLDTDESLGFVEVFSELGLRLLLLPIEPPPAGDGKQSARVELSGGRTIDANLNFSGPSPTLQITYDDPNTASETLVEPDTAIAATQVIETTTAIPFESDKPRLTLFSAWKSLLQPTRITGAFAALLIAALLFLKFAPTGKVSAAELLQKSAEAEEAKLANKERIFHRTLNFEERNTSGELLSRKRIDVWHSSERGMTARRLYDDQGALVMGDWRRADGIQTLYKRGESTRLQPSPDKRMKSIAFDEAWQLSATAKEFMALFEEFSNAQVETRTNDYLISYTPQSNEDAAGITNATIVLSKEDLHATEQTFTLRNTDEIREFRMVETGYEWKPANAVAPAVFEPNVELTGAATDPEPDREIPAETDTNILEQPAANAETVPAANIATAALELEVVEALNQAGAFTGEQISVARVQDGKILVSALLEATERKKALLAALANVRNNPAVQIKIETVEEIAARRRASSKNSAQATIVDQVEVDESSNPMLVELRERLSDDGARRFASGVIARSRLVRQRALAIKQISGRFSATDLQALTPEERRRLLSLIRGHANAFEREAQALLRDLQKVFPDLGGGEGRSVTIGSDAELQARIHELFDAAIAIENGTGSSFASGGKSSGPSPVKTVTFWRSLSNAAAIAKSLQLVK